MIDIEKLKALHEAATPAPWQTQAPSLYPEDNGLCIIGLRLNSDGFPIETPTNGLVAVSTQSPVEADEGDFERATANAEILTFVRNAVPEILDMADRLTRYEAALRNYGHKFCELGKWHECCGRLTEADCSGCLAIKALGDGK